LADSALTSHNQLGKLELEKIIALNAAPRGTTLLAPATCKKATRAASFRPGKRANRSITGATGAGYLLKKG
jgi:hypothetical protein